MLGARVLECWVLIFAIDQDDVNPSIICETSVSVRSVNLCGQDHVNPSIICVTLKI